MSQKSTNVALLLARLIIGGIFVYAGWMKVSAMAMTVGYFASMGIPAFLAYAVGYLELIGGVLLVIGFWAEIAALVLAVIMAVAVYYSFPGGFAMFGTPLAVFAGLMLISVSGAGKWAIGCKCGSCTTCKVGNGTCSVN
jgi:putative oxidoreductase